MPESFKRICVVEGDGCMKDTDHPIRHPGVHLGRLKRIVAQQALDLDALKVVLAKKW